MAHFLKKLQKKYRVAAAEDTKEEEADALEVTPGWRTPPGGRKEKDAGQGFTHEEAYKETTAPAGAQGKKWIKEAIKKPGQLHKDLGIPAGEKIPMKKIKQAEKEGGKVGQRARLADTLRHLHK